MVLVAIRGVFLGICCPCYPRMAPPTIFTTFKCEGIVVVSVMSPGTAIKLDIVGASFAVPY